MKTHDVYTFLIYLPFNIYQQVLTENISKHQYVCVQQILHKYNTEI